MSKIEGHFEITNSAISRLKRELPVDPFIAGVPAFEARLGRGELAHSIFGVMNLAATETESPAWGAVYRDLRDVFNLGHWNDAAQKHHFMRRLSGQCSRAAYDESVEWIRTEAERAIVALRANREQRTEENLFRGAASDHMGNALHALQDSFSASHVERVELTAGAPGRIAKVFVYAGHEKVDHNSHDTQWDRNGSFSDRGAHAMAATFDLLHAVVSTAARGGDALTDWQKFRRTWLQTDPLLDRHREDRNHALIADHLTSGKKTPPRALTPESRERFVEELFDCLGDDALNLRGLFEEINHAFPRERGPLAALYVRKVRASEAALPSVLARDPELRGVLVRCLARGWTSASDQECIDWLGSFSGDAR